MSTFTPKEKERIFIKRTQDLCTAMELCAGFGNEGIARIQRAVGPDVAVGAVKFDFHPGLGFKSGDALFG